MKRLLLVLLLVISSVALYVSESHAASPVYPTTVTLNILWRLGKAQTVPEYLTTSDPAERDRLSHLGVDPIFYIPQSTASDRRPLFRLFGANGDHMDSPTPGEGGFATQALLGYPWSSRDVSPGLSEIMRAYNPNPSTDDHVTQTASESFPGYGLEGVMGYGYARYGNAKELLLELSGGGVTIQSNAVAGGAIWRWFQGGVQFINNYDNGREIQSSLAYSENGDVSRLRNPTEGGDGRNGSPILNFHNAGGIQVTRAMPLLWKPQLLGGGPDNPVVYPDSLIGKEIHLNDAGLGSVAAYTTTLYLPVALGKELVPSVEIPTGYLRGLFNQFYTYDVLGQSLKHVYVPISTEELGCRIEFTTTYGGVIISDASTSHAMGVFGVNTKKLSSNSSVTRYGLYNFLNLRPPLLPSLLTTGTSEGDVSTSKWSAINEEPLHAGTNLYHTWIISGSLAEVRSKMDSLTLLLLLFDPGTGANVPTETKCPCFTMDGGASPCDPSTQQ